ncbi:MAG TPA: AAA family ATPase, partial [Burkholderiaceae bacterium]
AQLADFEPAAWCAAAARWLHGRRAELAPVFAARRALGAVRDGHGDLHLSNTVVLGDDVTAFDCIEFDPALRCIDVIADIAFMTMDLHAHGRPDLAHRFLDAYLAASGDYEGLALLRFHEAARACVRGLVQRLGPPADRAGAPDYLALATRRMTEGDARPRLAILCGPSGAGKSTIAARLVDLTGAVRVRSDVERKRLHATPTAAEEDASALYSHAATERTYGRLADCARAVMRAGFDVIVDAAFLDRARRDAFAALAAELGVAFVVLSFDAPPQELARRVARRAAAGGDPSDADEAVLAGQLRSRDPIAPRERARTIRVDTTQAVDVGRLAASWHAHPSSIAG